MTALRTLGYTGIPGLIAITVLLSMLIRKSAKNGTAVYALACPALIIISIISAIASCIIPAAIVNPYVMALRIMISAIMFLIGLFANIIIAAKRSAKSKDTRLTVLKGDVVTWNNQAKTWQKLN